MKHEFNEDKELIFLTVKDKGQKAYLKSWVKFFEPVKDDPEAQSKVILDPDGKGHEMVEILVREDCAEILRLMNGDPSEEAIAEWTRQIIEERQSFYRDAMKKAEEDFVLSSMASQRRYDDVEARIGSQLTGPKLSLQKAEKRIEKSPRLQLAQNLHDKANDPSRSSWQRRIDGIGFRLVAMEDAGLILSIPENREKLDRFQEQLKSNRKMEEREKEDARFQYENNHLRLEVMSKDPQMNERDRLLLQDKIRHYRLGHSEPDFIFRREEATERYRPERDIAQEQSRNRYDEIMNRTQGRGISRQRGRDFGRDR